MQAHGELQGRGDACQPPGLGSDLPANAEPAREATLERCAQRPPSKVGLHVFATMSQPFLLFMTRPTESERAQHRPLPGVQILSVLMLQAACATRTHLGPIPHLQPGGQRGVPSSYKQSCAFSPACAAPTASGELVIPTAQKLVDMAQIVRGVITLKDFLDEAEVARAL